MRMRFLQARSRAVSHWGTFAPLRLAAGGLGLALACATGPARAGDMDCSSLSGLERLSCLAVKGTTMVVGGAVVGATALGNAVTPGLSVKVQLPDGVVLEGRLSALARGQRKVSAGDTLRLVCTPNAVPTVGEYGFAYCELHYPKVPARPSSPDYYERRGEQPSFSLGANAAGFTQPQVLELATPLRWPAAPAARPGTPGAGARR